MVGFLRQEVSVRLMAGRLRRRQATARIQGRGGCKRMQENAREYKGENLVMGVCCLTVLLNESDYLQMIRNYLSHYLSHSRVQMLNLPYLLSVYRRSVIIQLETRKWAPSRYWLGLVDVRVFVRVLG